MAYYYNGVGRCYPLPELPLEPPERWGGYIPADEDSIDEDFLDEDMEEDE